MVGKVAAIFYYLLLLLFLNIHPIVIPIIILIGFVRFSFTAVLVMYCAIEVDIGNNLPRGQLRTSI